MDEWIDHVSILQVRCQKLQWDLPKYSQFTNKQPLFSNLPDFHISVTVKNHESHGNARSKKEAKRNAAKAMLEQLEFSSTSTLRNTRSIDSLGTIPDVVPSASPSRDTCTAIEGRAVKSEPSKRQASRLSIFDIVGRTGSYSGSRSALKRFSDYSDNEIEMDHEENMNSSEDSSHDVADSGNDRDDESEGEYKSESEDDFCYELDFDCWPDGTIKAGPPRGAVDISTLLKLSSSSPRRCYTELDRSESSLSDGEFECKDHEVPVEINSHPSSSKISPKSNPLRSLKLGWDDSIGTHEDERMRISCKHFDMALRDDFEINSDEVSSERERLKIWGRKANFEVEFYDLNPEQYPRCMCFLRIHLEPPLAFHGFADTRIASHEQAAKHAIEYGRLMKLI